MRVPKIGWPLALLVGASMLTIAHPVLADSWYEHYAKAEEALLDEDWLQAVEEINGALEKKGDSGARVRSYGMKVTPYFPYLKLGIAYYRLGQFDAAIQAFETETRLGAIAESDAAVAELEHFRELAREARLVAGAAEEQRVLQIVQTGLRDADELERRGLLDEAMAALNRILAVAPDNAKASTKLQQLRQLFADRQREQQLDDRVAQLVERGRDLVSRQQNSEAISVFRQALSLKPNEEVQALLDDALNSPQAELVTAADNDEAQAIQDRLLAAREQEDAESARRVTITKLLADAISQFESGHAEASLAAANRVLALDPGNDTALQYVAQAYRMISRDLLGPAARGNIPPAVRFVDQRHESDDGVLAQTIASPKFRLSGVVIDNSPVEIVFYNGEQLLPQPSIISQPLAGFYLTEFSVEAHLAPGHSTLRLVATDVERLVSSSEYDVVYTPPFFRTSWFYALLLSSGAALAGVLLWQRSRHRDQLRKRRFNPYVAGSPVLDDDMFFGRRDLVDRILQTIHNNSLLIYGERRIGKTSIQHQLKKRLREIDDPVYEFYAVYVDLQGTPETRFFRTIAEEIMQELGPLLGDQLPGKDMAGSYSSRDLTRDIRGVLKALKQHTSKKIRLVLLIDEVDELNDYDPRINQKLRSLFMKSFAENLAAVVSGVEIKKRWEREGSPWYNFFEEIRVEPFGPDDARELIERPIRGMFKLDDGVVERIIELTDGKPYLIQKLCIALVTRLHEQNRRKITMADVDAVHGAT